MSSQPSLQQNRVVLFDPHPIICAGLQERLNQEPDLAVRGWAHTDNEALTLCLGIEPQLIIMEIPSGRRWEVIRQLKETQPEVKILVFTQESERLVGETVFGHGADGFLSKHRSTTEVVAAARSLLAGGMVMSGRSRQGLVARAVHGSKGLNALSPREREIFELMGRGLDAEKIAASLEINVKTVETFRGRMKRKLGLRNLEQLLVHAANWLEDRRRTEGTAVADREPAFPTRTLQPHRALRANDLHV